MAISERELQEAGQRSEDARAHGHATNARYDRRRGRIVISLNTGVELTFPADLAQGLKGADPAALEKIEISPGGLGLHWPELDADLSIPALLEGLLGSRTWMASKLGAAGGKSRSDAKARASRANGQLGGRPRKGA